MATFLLVHGAWHGAWCWERLTPLLEARGHKVVAPDLPGMGEDPTPLEDVSVEQWSEFIASAARRQDEPVILVGHSRAGIVVSQAGEYARESIAALVYLAAFLVPNGKTLEGVMRQIPARPESAGSLVMNADDTTSRIADDAVQRVFFNTTRPDLVERAKQLVGAEPMRSFTTPAHLTDARWGSIPRYYIECTEDRAIAPALQRMMQEKLPCRRAFQLSTDHSPFYSAPEALTECLDAIAADVGAVLTSASANSRLPLTSVRYARQ